MSASECFLPGQAALESGRLEPDLGSILASALEHLKVHLEQDMPLLAPKVFTWLAGLSSSNQPTDRFLGELMYPIFLLPWSLEEELADGQTNIEWQVELITSSLGGYYYIKLIDDLVDGDVSLDPQLAPAAPWFFWHFQRPYQKHFPLHHPFWHSDFPIGSFGSCDEIRWEQRGGPRTRAEFREVAVQKCSLIRLPLILVADRYSGRQRLPPWLELAEVLACLCQMLDDVTDWRSDLAWGRSYFLTYGRAAAGGEENLPTWILTDGLRWALSEIAWWWEAVQRASEEIRSQTWKARLERLEAAWRCYENSLTVVLATLENLCPAVSSQLPKAEFEKSEVSSLRGDR